MMKKLKPTANTEEDSLEQFCAAVELEECTFELWAQSHDHLDLYIKVYISPQEAQLGCTREVQFSRTLYEKSVIKDKKNREKKSLLITIPAGCVEGLRISVPQEGDCSPSGQRGCVHFEIHIH